jgi:hypothetical protein
LYKKPLEVERKELIERLTREYEPHLKENTPDAPAFEKDEVKRIFGEALTSPLLLGDEFIFTVFNKALHDEQTNGVAPQQAPSSVVHQLVSTLDKNPGRWTFRYDGPNVSSAHATVQKSIQTLEESIREHTGAHVSKVDQAVKQSKEVIERQEKEIERLKSLLSGAKKEEKTIEKEDIKTDAKTSGKTAEATKADAKA